MLLFQKFLEISQQPNKLKVSRMRRKVKKKNPSSLPSINRRSSQMPFKTTRKSQRMLTMLQPSLLKVRNNDKVGLEL
jgi:hypothetical protein